MWLQIGNPTTIPTSALDPYRINLGNVNPSLQSSITLYLNAKSDFTHTITVTLNGTLLPGGTITWTGRTAKAQTVSISTGILKDTENTLILKDISTYPAGVWLDAFSVRFKTDSTVLSGDNFFFGQPSGTLTYTAYLSNPDTALLYDTTSPHTPVRLTGFSPNTTNSSITFQDTASGTPHAYLATTNIRPITFPENLRVSPVMQTAAPDSATYLIIAPPNFLSGVATLTAHRQSKGQDVAVENAQAIFDKYGEGLPTPQAIKAFLQDVYDHWSTVPQYVVLVGDGTWDPKHYQHATPSYIPPYLQMISQGEYAADNRYVTLEGDDILPDMMIGRLPVNDASQLATMITKITQYENNPPDGDWRRRGTVIADYPWIDYGDYDFVKVANAFSNKMSPAPYLKEKIYYKVNYLTGAATKSAILNAWNTGTAVLTFTGHASWHAWGGKYISETLKNEELFHLNDVPSLTNGYKLPFVLEFNCESSRFDHPGFEMLDEALVRKSNGGAIITFGPTSPGFTGSHEKLGLGFLGDLHSGEATAGTAMDAAKLYLSIKDPNNIYLVDTYTILGDPAVKI